MLSRLARLVDAEEVAGDAVEAARVAGDRSAQARSLVVLGNVRWLRGDTAACLEALQEARDLLAATPSDPASVDVLGELRVRLGVARSD